MVLVSCILINYISILQTKSSDREGHEARHGGLEAMPLAQHIEGGHGAREAGVEIRPAPGHDLLAVHNERQQREHRLERCYRRQWRWHTPTPRPPPTAATRDRVCRQQSSDNASALCGRSAVGSGLRAWGGAARGHPDP